MMWISRRSVVAMIAAATMMPERRVMTELDLSLDRSVPDTEAKSNTGEAMWW